MAYFLLLFYVCNLRKYCAQIGCIPVSVCVCLGGNVGKVSNFCGLQRAMGQRNIHCSCSLNINNIIKYINASSLFIIIITNTGSTDRK